MRICDLIKVYRKRNICKIVVLSEDEERFIFMPEEDEMPEETYWRFETKAINERCLNYLVKSFEVVACEKDTYNSILYIEIDE